MEEKIIIIDFQYLYYKYKNAIKSGKMKSLSSTIDNKVIDTSIMYYILKEIEQFNNKGKICTAICFDSKSIREDENKKYKSNRKVQLDENDFNEIDTIRDILASINYNVYKIQGMEADDIAEAIARDYSCEYVNSTIYTIDKDLMQLIKQGVDVNLYRISKGYINISMVNFEEFSQQAFKTYIPYNMIMAYKSLCGDPSDGISGIKKFGPAAFSKWISNWSGVDFTKGTDKEFVKELIEKSIPVDKQHEALSSLEMVAFKGIKVDRPTFIYDSDKRIEIFSKLGFNSLLK